MRSGVGRYGLRFFFQMLQRRRNLCGQAAYLPFPAGQGERIVCQMKEEMPSFFCFHLFRIAPFFQAFRKKTSQYGPLMHQIRLHADAGKHISCSADGFSRHIEPLYAPAAPVTGKQGGKGYLDLHLGRKHAAVYHVRIQFPFRVIIGITGVQSVRIGSKLH